MSNRKRGLGSYRRAVAVQNVAASSTIQITITLAPYPNMAIPFSTGLANTLAGASVTATLVVVFWVVRSD